MHLVNIRRTRFGLVALSLLCACAGWERLEIASDTALAPSQQVQVWRGSQVRVLHAVRVIGDSLVGIPFQKPASCDSCRLAMPRSTVDSLRLGNMEPAGFALSALPFLAILFLAAALSGMGD
jgi:hypothetical protein